MSQFKNEHDKIKNQILMPKVLDEKVAEDFTASSQTWMLLPVEEHIFDFKDVMVLDRSIYFAISAFAKILKQNSKRLHSVNMKTAMITQVATDGMKDIFSPINPKATSEKPKGKIDVHFINPFLDAVQLVFTTQANTPVIPGKPFIPTGESELKFELVGVISLNCTQFQGNIALCFPAEVFLKIYERMLGEKHSAINSEIEDGVGELLNIIYGTAKTTLNKEQGLDLKPALPAVLTGDRIKVRRPPQSQVLVLPFNSEAGTFHVEISRILHSSNEQRRAS